MAKSTIKKKVFFNKDLPEKLIKEHKLDGVIILGYQIGVGVSSAVKVKANTETLVNIGVALDKVKYKLLESNPDAAQQVSERGISSLFDKVFKLSKAAKEKKK